MGRNITIPWKIHLRGSAQSHGRNWWARRRFHDDSGAHPALMQEQDLDHLGILHDRVAHRGRN